MTEFKVVTALETGSIVVKLVTALDASAAKIAAAAECANDGWPVEEITEQTVYDLRNVNSYGL